MAECWFGSRRRGSIPRDPHFLFMFSGFVGIIFHGRMPLVRIQASWLIPRDPRFLFVFSGFVGIIFQWQNAWFGSRRSWFDSA